MKRPVAPVAACQPTVVQVHPRDNVAIVASDEGLASGARLPDGLVLREAIAQGH